MSEHASNSKMVHTARRTARRRDAMAPPKSIVAAWRAFCSRGQAVERVGGAVGAFLIVSGLIHLGILVIAGGSWHGPLSLRKPGTFGLSFGLTLITIVWVASLLRLGAGARRWLLGVFTAACALETALVTLQAWRGVPSHFNLETTFDGFVARTLAAGGMALVATILVLTLVSFRANPAVPISLRIAIRIGFVSLLGAVGVGALMIAKGMMLVFAGHPQAAYATGGTLKPTHAVTMHGILVLPLLAWLLSFADWSERRRMGVVLTAAAGYVAVVGVVVVTNVMGIALGRMPAAMTTILGVGVAVVLGIGLLAGQHTRRSANCRSAAERNARTISALPVHRRSTMNS